MVDKPAERIRVSEADYLAQYAERRFEWVDGELIDVSPVTLLHFDLVVYLLMLLKAYMNLNPIGKVYGQPVVMKISADSPNREPDLMVVLNSNPAELTETRLLGAADICIEVISEATADQDYGKKFIEYEKGGVAEYWTVDPEREECRFHRRKADGYYETIVVGADATYRTPLLPKFVLHIPTLWQTPLPNLFEVANAVRAMFAE